MRERRRVEARARITQVVDDGARRPRGGDLDHLLGIEAAAMLHRVQEHLPERGHQQIGFAIIGEEPRLKLRHEAHEPIGRQQAARHSQRQPVRRTSDPSMPSSHRLAVTAAPTISTISPIGERPAETGEHLRPERGDRGVGGQSGRGR